MDVNVLLICDKNFSDYKILIENLDRYLEPLIEFDANVCIHFDYDTNLREDIIDYACVRKFTFKVNTKELPIHEQRLPEKIIESYDCAILFVDAYHSKIRALIDLMTKIDFKFRIINYLKLNNYQ